MKDVFTPQSNAPIGKVSRKFGKDTKTWKIFEALFLDPSMEYPYTIHPISKGEAINLAIGLNCCNRQWAEEQNLPREFIQFSAKALRGADDSSWSLEISTNHRQQRTSTSSSWMDKYLSADNGPASSPSGEASAAGASPSGTEASGTEAPSPQGENTPPAEPKISHMESAVENWFFTPSAAGASPESLLSAPRADSPEADAPEHLPPSPPSMEELGGAPAGVKGEEK